MAKADEQIDPTIYTSGDYFAKNPDWHEGDSAWKAKHISALLRRNQLKPNSICDVGCGTGEIIRILATEMSDAILVGYEISPQAYSRAREKESEKLFYHNTDPFNTSQVFDLVMGIDVFEHVDDYLGFLRQMRRIGRKQIYHIPLDLSVQGVLRRTGILNAREKLGHLHYFFKETALASLEYTGHRIIDWCYTAGAVELKSRSTAKRFGRFPRQLAFALVPDFAVRALGGYSLLVLCE